VGRAGVLAVSELGRLAFIGYFCLNTVRVRRAVGAASRTRTALAARAPLRARCGP
jgi:hypothetical protein